MAVKSKAGIAGTRTIHLAGKPKKTRQGRSRNTNLAATPTRAKRRRYRGQGN